jgi:hypothetical protein
MLLDANPENLILEIGHEGDEVWFPRKEGSESKRSFHPAEINDCCMRRGYALSLIEMSPRTGPSDCQPGEDRLLFDLEFSIQRFIASVKDHAGILICRVPESHLGHACAWDGKKVYDPRGIIGELEDYEISEMWILTKLI